MNAQSSTHPPNIVDLLLDAVFMVDVYGLIVYASAACERIFGYTPDEMVGRKMIDLVAPEDRARTWAEADLVMAGLPRVGFENRYIRKDGRLVHIMWSARWSESDQLRIGVARDITDRKRAEDMQAATYAIAEAARSATDLVAMFREIHHLMARLVSAAGFAVTLLDAKTGRPTFPYQMDLSGHSFEAHADALRQLITEGVRSRHPVMRPIGDPGRQESWIALPLLSANEVFGALILKSHPGTLFSEKDTELLQFVSTQVAAAIERRRLHDELLRAARCDDLTGLPNRRLFQDRMKSALARTRRHANRFALLYIDIDDFKHVNDSLGHTAGDQLLREVAVRLQQCVREEDTVARMGGDEFVVLLEEIQLREDALLVADKILAAISHPIQIEGHLLCMQSSIGVSLYPDDGISTDELLKHADKKMYQAKKAKIAAT